MSKLKSKTVFLCSSCGEDYAKWLGQCPNCREWGTLSEFKVRSDRPKSSLRGKKDIVALSDILEKEVSPRMVIGLNEVDRVLGGGILPGSVILLAGNPGIGKSTLALQILPHLKNNTLYFSAEESEEQVALRAHRLNIRTDFLHLSSENRLEYILDQIMLVKPALVIIDSIQTIMSESLDSLPGSVSQVRECGQKFLQLSKQENISILIIGHVTKDGSIAGPKMLEHMVDTVLYLEGDDRHDHRILRAVKNRFGTTNEVGIFRMNAGGLIEVNNPSEMFLSERPENISGSTVFPSLEGSRPILVEVQALVSKANFGTPQRNVTGFDLRRLSMLLAVIEKRENILMGMKDVFVNFVGGLKVDDPAADLAVISAIVSSVFNKVIPKNTVQIGEVGLGGEVRSVSQLNKRVNESVSQGIKTIYAPASNVGKLKKAAKGIKIIPVKSVSQVMKKLFP